MHLRLPIAVVAESRRNKEHPVPVRPFRPADCIGNFIAPATVATAEYYKHPPLTARNLPIVFRHSIPYRRISIVLRTSANGDMGNALGKSTRINQ